MLSKASCFGIFQKHRPHKKVQDTFCLIPGKWYLGRRVLEGAKQVSMLGKGGRVEAVGINCGIDKLDGFSGHSDYNQLMSFVQKLRPKLRRVFVNHGERRKSENLAASIRRMYRLPTHAPQIQETMKLF